MRNDFLKVSLYIDPLKVSTYGTSPAGIMSGGAWGFCGGNLGTATPNTDPSTICCEYIINVKFVKTSYFTFLLLFSAKHTPFSIRFLSDLYESNTETPKLQNGFRLAYILKGCWLKYRFQFFDDE